mgnify:CR=1 FL=1
MTATSNRLKVGVSACFFHPNEERSLFKGKTLQYIEQSVAHWIMSQGDLAVMIPSPEGNTQIGDAQLNHYAEWLDALVLMGGSDVWPGSYGETALDPRWEGDRIRDQYDKGLIDAESARHARSLLRERGLVPLMQPPTEVAVLVS